MTTKFFPKGCKVTVVNHYKEGTVTGYLDPLDLGSVLPCFYVAFAGGEGNGYRASELRELEGERVGTLEVPD